MGTNYYVSDLLTACQRCGHSAESPLHLGKSSGGWCFSLHVIPEKGLNSLDDWESYWNGKQIRDEYQTVMSPVEMMTIITKRLQCRSVPPDFAYSLNHAEPGANGLIRSKIDGQRCVGHGPGTWDLIAGEFS